jgi:transcription-repair coupling factor (superfamily II helicase)
LADLAPDILSEPPPLAPPEVMDTVGEDVVRLVREAGVSFFQLLKGTRKHLALDDAHGALAPAIVAATQEVLGTSVLVVTPTDEMARRFTADLRLLWSCPGGEVLQNPSLEVTGSDDEAEGASSEGDGPLHDLSSLSDRLRILLEVGRAKHVVVTSQRGLSDNVPSTQSLAKAAYMVRRGDRLDVPVLLDALADKVNDAHWCTAALPVMHKLCLRLYNMIEED